MTLTLYNTLSKKREEFTPLKKKNVGYYTCGPTVYNFAHIGNLRSYIFEDILKRVLLLNGYKVNHVMNITDVGHLASDADDGEDKMTKGLKREGLPLTLDGMKQLAQKYTDAFFNDLKRLNILEPNEIPNASEHITEDIEFIKKLEKNGFVYKTTDGLYFDTSKCTDYGKLIGATQREEDSQARIDTNSEKKQPQDFALWKFNENLGWDTPWGKGFPGWHIECSVMASKYLGEQFDIHCGGIDHIPIHHTNEIAQSEAAFGKTPWVKYWLHNEFLVLGKNEKMAKSGDNFVTLGTLDEKGYSALDYRYFCLGTQYRNPLTFSYDALDAAKTARRKLNDKVLEYKQAKLESKNTTPQTYMQQFMDAVNDDLNTPKALAVMWELIKDTSVEDAIKYKFLLEFDEVLGLGLKDLKAEQIPQNVIDLAEKRLEARNKKEWEKSDGLRDEISKLGYEVGDTQTGYELKKK